MRSVQFWCDFTATQYAVPGSLAADEANEIGGSRRCTAGARGETGPRSNSA
jgi:hypothetical protein